MWNIVVFDKKKCCAEVDDEVEKKFRYVDLITYALSVATVMMLGLEGIKSLFW